MKNKSKIMKHKVFESSDSNVMKFVFEDEAEIGRKAIAVEAVLYKYPTYGERTVICCSVQSGCPVGCNFCGTGMFFQRNLSSEEIVEQVETVLQYIDCNPSDIKKFQIMFMSMGEPFMNYENTEKAIRILNKLYPNAALLVSTSAPGNRFREKFDQFIDLSREIKNVGLQFSLHESNDDARGKLIPTPTICVAGIASYGHLWAMKTGRKPFFNYCVHAGNSSQSNVNELKDLFNPSVWEVTLSVICEKNQSMKSAIEQQMYIIGKFQQKMMDAGYSLRVFNPAGQDDIGGGCGQLWYFQEWLEKQKNQINHK